MQPGTPGPRGEEPHAAERRAANTLNVGEMQKRMRRSGARSRARRDASCAIGRSGPLAAS